MTRFRQLLTPNPRSTPGEEQQRASVDLAEAVRQSKLRWKGGRGPLQCQEKCLLLAVAPYSQYDLVSLDSARRAGGRAPSGAGLRHQPARLRLSRSAWRGFPRHRSSSSVAGSCAFRVRNGTSGRLGEEGERVVAATLGLPAEELMRRVVEESPSSSSRGGLRATGAATAQETNGEEQLDDEQLRFLWKTYREEQESGGPARDRLPSPRHFEHICNKVNARFNKVFNSYALWMVLLDLDRSPDRRQRLGFVD